MHVLLVTQYFWPENFLINDLARQLNLQGVTVTVLTGKPNYPSGQVFPGHRAMGCEHERFENISIHRVPIVPRGQKSRVGLVLNYLSFIASAGMLGRRVLRGAAPFDVVFVYAPSPLLQALAAVRLARLYKLPLVVWVQDLWPESLSATGHVKNSWLLGMVAKSVKRIYRATDRILVQSRAFVAPVAALTDQPGKIHYYPNLYQPHKDSHPSKNAGDLAQRLHQHFNVVFAGNLGTAQALDIVVEAARKLQPHTRIRLVLVGSGSMGPWLAEQCAQKNLRNVVLPGRFDASDMPTILGAASALLVSLRADPAFALTIPSKIQAYLAAGRPIIASLDGEGARIVEESGSGFCCPAGNAELLAEAILRMAHTPLGEREAMGKRGQQYFHQHFAPAHLVEQLKMHFNDVISAKREAP